ncbi:Domain unknown function DUF295 - like 10 [Theobroma cacao]|nr:Domain unknown function DUF295 - like 10 [Theobroma cacao]
MSACRKVEDNVDSAYLVESSTGDLFSIKKEIDVEDYHPCAHFTKNFKVFKLVLDDQSGRLLEKEAKNMNGDVVFVGDNHTLAVSALDFPEGQPNSIYFTDDYYIATEYWPLGPRDIGFFNMKDGKKLLPCFAIIIAKMAKGIIVSATNILNGIGRHFEKI